MMKKYGFYLFLLLIGCLTVTLIISNNGIRKKEQEARDSEDRKISEFNRLNIDINKEMAGKAVPDIICEDINYEKMNLSSLVSDGPVLFYRYSELNCNTCYETEISLLQKYFLNDYKGKVIILCSYEIRKYFTTFKKINQIKLPLYRIPQDTFDWLIEDYLNPYYFLLQPDMKISNVYIPDKSYPELSVEYLKKVKSVLKN